MYAGTLTISRSAPKDHSILRFWLDGYLANRDSFEFLTCRFTVTKGIVSTVEEALAGEFQKPTKAEGLLIFDGKRMRYEIQGEENTYHQSISDGVQKALQENPRAGRIYVSVPFHAERRLSDGDLHLSFNIYQNKGSIRSANELSPDYMLAPLAFDLMGADPSFDPAPRLERAIAGGLPVRIATLELSPLGSRQGVMFQDGEWEHTYCFNPDEGFLPVYSAGRASDAARVLARQYITQSMQTEKGWFPKRVVLLLQTGENPRSLLATEILVSHLDISHRPAASDFAIDVAANSNIVRPPNMRAYVVIVFAHQDCIAHGYSLRWIGPRCVVLPAQKIGNHTNKSVSLHYGILGKRATKPLMLNGRGGIIQINTTLSQEMRM
jgi:hypothetical protein